MCKLLIFQQTSGNVYLLKMVLPGTFLTTADKHSAGVFVGKGQIRVADTNAHEIGWHFSPRKHPELCHNALLLLQLWAAWRSTCLHHSLAGLCLHPQAILYQACQ